VTGCALRSAAPELLNEAAQHHLPPAYEPAALWLRRHGAGV